MAVTRYVVSDGGSINWTTMAPAAGDLMILVAANDGGGDQSTPSGWTDLNPTKNAGSNTVTANVFYLVATGSESGTVDFDGASGTNVASEQDVGVILKIPAAEWHGTTPPECTQGGATSGTATAPSITPSWGALADTIFIPAVAFDHTRVDASAIGSNYATNFSWDEGIVGNTGTCGIASSWRTANTTTESPGSLTQANTAEEWIAFTIAVRPAAATGPETQAVSGAATPAGSLVLKPLSARSGAITPAGAKLLEAAILLGTAGTYDDLVLATQSARLQGFWPCDDASGGLARLAGSYDASLAAGSPTYQAAGPTIGGVPQDAVQFDGTAYFTVSSAFPGASAVNGRTVLVWVYLPGDSSAAGNVVSRLQTNEREFEVLHASDGTATFSPYQTDGNTKVAQAVGSDLDGGTWYCLIGWWDPADQDAYLQTNGGTPVSAAGSTDIITDSGAPIGIGATGFGGSPLRSGARIAKVAIWDTVLSSGERAALYSGAGASGGIAPSGTVDPQAISLPTVSIAGAVTPAGARASAVASLDVGAITPAATVAKDVTARHAGAITPAGAAAKKTRRALSGSVAPAGARAGAPASLDAGAVTPTGSLARNIAQALAGSVTPSGSRIGGLTAALGGGLTAQGAVSHVVGALRGGVVTPVGTLLRDVAHALAGAITPAGSVATATGMRLLSAAGSVTPTGALARAVAQRLSSAINPTGVFSAAASVVLAGVLEPLGTLTRFFAVAASGVIAPVGALAFALAKALTGSVTPIGALIDKVARSLGGELVPAGALAAIGSLTRAVSGAITPIGEVYHFAFAWTEQPRARVRELVLGALAEPLGWASRANRGIASPWVWVAARTLGWIVGRVRALRDWSTGAASSLWFGAVMPMRGTLSHAVSALHSGVIVPAGQVAHDFLVSASGSVEPHGVLYIPPAADAITPSGAITPTGAYTSAAQVLDVGAITPAGTELHDVATIETGTIAPAGALSRDVATSVSGSVAPSGHLELPAEALAAAGEATPAGELAVLGGIAQINVTQTSFQVEWYARPAMSGRVEYDTDPGFGTSLLTNKQVTPLEYHAQFIGLNNPPGAPALTPGQTYYCRIVESTTAGGMTVMSDSYAFTAAFAQALLAGGITPLGALTNKLLGQVQTISLSGSVGSAGGQADIADVTIENIQAGSFDVRWQARPAMSGRIEWADNPSFSGSYLTNKQVSPLTEHVQQVGNGNPAGSPALAAGATYYFRIVESTTADGMTVVSSTQSQTMPGGGGAYEPATWGNGLAALESSSGQSKQNLELQNGWCSYRFTAWESSDIAEVRIGFTNRTTSYGGGNGGRYRCAIVNNGAGDLPGSTVYGWAETDTPIMVSPDAFNAVFSFSTPVAVVAGTKYHLYITNVDPSPTTNWSSINNPWNINGSAHPIYEGEDTAFLAASSHYSTAENNSRAAASAPAFAIEYTNGKYQGHAANRGADDGIGIINSGSYVQWIVPSYYDDPITFDAVGIYLWKVSGSTDLACTVYKNGVAVATGTFTGSGGMTAGTYANAAWVEAQLSAAVSLTSGDRLEVRYRTTAGEYRCQVLLCSAANYSDSWRLFSMPYDGATASRHEARDDGSFIWSNWSSHTVLSSYVRRQ